MRVLTALQLEALKMMTWALLPFRVMHRGPGRRGGRYNFEIHRTDGLQVQCEVKSRVSSSEPNSSVIANALRHAREQVPAGGCNAVFLKIPDPWLRFPDWADVIEAAVHRQFRGSTRFSSVICYVNALHVAYPGQSFNAVRLREWVNPGSRSTARIGRGLMGEWDCPRPNWLGFPGLTPKSLRSVTAQARPGWPCFGLRDGREGNEFEGDAPAMRNRSMSRSELPFEEPNVEGYRLLLRIEVALRELLARESRGANRASLAQPLALGEVLQRIRESEREEEKRGQFDFLRLGPLYYLDFGQPLAIIQQQAGRAIVARFGGDGFIEQTKRRVRRPKCNRARAWGLPVRPNRAWYVPSTPRWRALSDAGRAPAATSGRARRRRASRRGRAGLRTWLTTAHEAIVPA